MNFPSSNVDVSAHACDYAGRVSLLHVQKPDGGFRQVHGSRMSDGYFCSLIASRPDIIRVLSPAQSGPVVQPSLRYDEPTIKDRGLFIVAADFGPSDWLIAIEAQMASCDPGMAYHLLMGKLPEGIESVTQLVNLLNLFIGSAGLLDSLSGALRIRRYNLVTRLTEGEPQRSF